MALIRLVSHFPLNPKHIDKMIAIKGLPKEWIFRGEAGDELIPPWKPDNPQNIPLDIRHLCEPTYITVKYAPVERGVNGVIERKQMLGLVLDFMTEPGRELWEKIERFIEGTLPRTERVPIPVLLAKDEHAPFETHIPRKAANGSIYLEPSPIPLIDLTPYLQPVAVAEVVVEVPPTPPSPPETPKPQPEEFKCSKCDYKHRSKQGIRMHEMKKHPIKEKVGA
jgi:hypothetical protein